MMVNLKRYVVGPDEEGRSAVLESEPTNIQSQEGFFWRATLWGTKETPADNSIEGDRSVDMMAREPFPNGMLCRAVEIPPDPIDPEEHRRVIGQLHKAVDQKIAPTQQDLQRHPSMHRTDTLDCLTCVKGEVYLVTDVEEVLMTPGDTVIIRGTNHAWKNLSDAPCLLIGSMIDATPKAAASS